MADTKLPLQHWWLAMYFICHAKNGISALELMRHLDVCYRTAWRLKHKVMAAMADREASRQLQGLVQIDDAYLGGERPSGPSHADQWTKLVGVAPLNCDSGQRRGQRHIHGGRAGLRSMLYMATLTAIRWEPLIRDCFARLKARGKPGKVALVACMRKLLTILNARRRDELRAAPGAA